MTGKIGLLYTYAEPSRAAMTRAAYAEQAGIPIVWDSGAWSVYTRGVNIDVDTHAQWIKQQQNRGSTARFIGLDVIGDPSQTLKNHKRQTNKGANVEATIHYGTPVEQINKFTHTTQWLNIGGVAGMTKGNAPVRARAFVELITKHAQTHHLQVHGLGATHPTITKRVGLNGIDSTYWMSGARYGLLPLFNPSKGDWIRLNYRTRNQKTRAKGWHAIHEHGRWLRQTYNITPAELNNANDETIRNLSIASHGKYAEWLAQRYQQTVIVYLAGATGIPEKTIDQITRINNT